MAKEWIVRVEGKNTKFKREALLNYGLNRWGLNKAYSVGKTSELIRACAPKAFEEWEEFYFNNAVQNKKNGIKITREYIVDLGQTLYVKLSEVVQNELQSITEEECIDYAYNLVINRTYEGYQTEIVTIYGQLEELLQEKIQPAPDEWDRKYSVDFFIQILRYTVGIQIKPISSRQSLNQYQWIEINNNNNRQFENDFGGKVFNIFSVGTGKKKRIYNIETVEEIRSEINRLKVLQNLQ